jgi:predicted O-linked N-acetylglucosamine transferase (SPINDLY family)
VLTSDIRGVREQVGDAGVLVNPKDAISIAKGILKIWQDGKLRNDLTKKGKERLQLNTPHDFKDKIYFTISNLRDLLIKDKGQRAEISDINNNYNESGHDNEIIEQFRQNRKSVALKWLGASGADLPLLYAGEGGKLHRNILNSPLKEFALSMDELQVAEMIINQMQHAGNLKPQLNYLLAAMLYFFPYQMPVETNIEFIPDWFLKDYCKFLFTPPNGFFQLGEVDGYYQYFSNIVDVLHRHIYADPGATPWLKMGVLFIEHANFIPLYVCQQNLKDLYIKRAEITEQVLKRTGFQLDYQLPQRPSKRFKIRLGVYSKSIEANTETFASLPVYRHLDPGEFEKYIYVHTQNGNLSERSAQAWADKFTVLPIDIKRCVEIMRQDDLDILFFSNNLTAVSNEPYLLANHRIARVQCVHFCQPNTTGQPYMDYFILGNLISGQSTPDECFSEKIAKTQGSGICFEINSSNAQKNELAARKQFEIDHQRIVFVSGANFFKITPELCHSWAHILSAVPKSILVMYPFGPAWTKSYPVDAFIRHVKDTFAQYKLKENRFRVLDTLPNRDAIKTLLHQSDIYLDAVPYSGATSLLDPLEVGVPPVVWEGPQLRFCQGALLLKELGMRDLIVRNKDDYITMAIRLANDANFRFAKREEIIEKMKSLPEFQNPVKYSRQIGNLFKQMLQPA